MNIEKWIMCILNLLLNVKSKSILSVLLCTCSPHKGVYVDRYQLLQPCWMNHIISVGMGSNNKDYKVNFIRIKYNKIKFLPPGEDLCLFHYVPQHYLWIIKCEISSAFSSTICGIIPLDIINVFSIVLPQMRFFNCPSSRYNSRIVPTSKVQFLFNFLTGSTLVPLVQTWPYNMAVDQS